MDKKISAILIYGLPLLIAAALKIFIWPTEITPFNADEAIVGLMARHINSGQYPLFFYGQYYMGSLDALIVGLGFRIFGEHVWVIRLVQSILYLGTVVTTTALASRILKSSKAALFAGLLAAIPPVYATLYTTASLGGYGEMLLIGNLLLLGGIDTIKALEGDEIQKGSFLWGLFTWGLGAGFAFWVIGLSLVFTAPIVFGLIWNLVRKKRRFAVQSLLALGLGGLAGAAPWWWAALEAGNLSVISELAGGAIAGVNPGNWFQQIIQRASNLFIFGGTVITGFRPPWSIQWLLLPMLPFVLIFWSAVLIHSAQRMARNKLTSPYNLVAMIGLILSLGFIFSPYGDDPSGRYFLPLVVPMSIFGADLIANQLGMKKYLQAGLIGFLLIYNFGGTIQSIKMNPTGLTTQFDPVAQVDHSRMEELIDFLEANHINAGYSNYWVSYPLAFLSQEEIIFIPRLPYHEDFRYTARDDRYPPYTELVEASNDIAYITTKNPELDLYLEERFQKLNISWREERIGDYTVYYQLSSPVRVSELGLGETTNP